MDAMRDRTLDVLVGISESVGARPPAELDLGEEHDAMHPEEGGDVLHFIDADGHTHVSPLRERTAD